MYTYIGEDVYKAGRLPRFLRMTELLVQVYTCIHIYTYKIYI